MEQIKVDQNAQNIAVIAAAVAQLQRKTDFILKQMNLEYHDDLVALLQPELLQRLQALVRQGGKGELEAIKLYRAQAGGGMLEAQSVVEELKRR